MYSYLAPGDPLLRNRSSAALLGHRFVNTSTLERLDGSHTAALRDGLAERGLMGAGETAGAAERAGSRCGSRVLALC